MPAFFPKRRFQVSGENVNFIPEVSFGGARVEDLVYEGTTGISGMVPPDALTDALFINNGLGLVPYNEFGPLQVVLDSESQVVGGYLEDDTVSGKAGELINITGENFYHITTVKFGETESTFTVDSDKEINVLIPTNAGYGGVTIFSSERTGLAGSITEASGISPNSFVPIADVTGLSSGFLVSGETLIIQGESFSAVTGVTFSRMEAHPSAISVSDVTSTSLNLIIPSGRVQGSPIMHMRSGISTQALPDISFTQDVRFINTSYSGFEGANLGIYGHNFTTGTLHPVGEIEGSSPSRSGYLVQFGEETGMFDLDPTYHSPVINGLRRLSGVIPSGIPIELKSGLVGAGSYAYYYIEQVPISIYQDNYPLTYASTGKFRRVPESPTILSVTPSSGISGDAVVIEGTDLYSITGVLFTGYSAEGNVGAAGSFPVFDITNVDQEGRLIEVSVPNAVEDYVPETNYGIVLSGVFGNTSFGLSTDINTGFVGLGKPEIDPNFPVPNGLGVETLVQPNSTGIISGSGIYSGTEVLIYKGSVNDDANLLAELPTSGYSTTGGNNVVEFTYPNAFDYLYPQFIMRLRNERGYSTNLKAIQAFRRPVISGFTPLSGIYGDTIALTGFFGTPASTWSSSNTEGPIVPTGMAVGQMKVGEGDFALASENLIFFEIPENATSDIIHLTTSGGSSSSNQILTVSPPRPYISGYYPGGGDKPYTGINNTGFSGDQVFGRGNLLTITGSRMNLVTGVLFSGAEDTFGIDSFVQQTHSTVVLHVPQNINPESGHFILKDFENRDNNNAVSSVYTNKFPVPLNIASVSGLSGLLRPLQPFGLSGQNISGLVPSFPTPTGGLTNQVDQGISDIPSYYIDSYGVETLEVTVPRGITDGSVRLSGQGNSFVLETDVPFLPLATAASITPGLGHGGWTVTSGDNMLITGYNSYNPNAASGSLLVGITGTGNKDDREQVYFYPVDSYESGTGGLGTLPWDGGVRDIIEFQLDSGFIGTGRFFIVNPWETFTDIDAEFPGSLSASGETLNNQIGAYPFQYVIQGTRVDVTGYTPVRGVTGDNVTISGEGFTAISGVFFEIPDGPILEADFTLNSDTKITATIPKEGIEARGMTTILLSGGTNDTVPDFEVLLDTAAVKFNVLGEGDIPVDTARTSQYSIEETQDGVVYIVTRTRFPDGTTTLISSVPKP